MTTLTGLALLLLAAPVRVEFPFFAGGEGVQFFEEAARAYERERPGVRIDAEGDPRIADKLRIRLLEGTLPEVTNAELEWHRLIAEGLVAPLDEALDGPSWDGGSTWRQSFLPGALDRFRVGGKTYGVPLFYSVYTVWYNRALFARHGWKPPRTWDELLALAERIQAAGVAPFAFQGRYHEYANEIIDGLYFQIAGRERFYAQKALEPGSFDNPEMRRALGYVQRAATRYFQPGAMGMSHTEAQLELFEGRAAMIFCGSWLKSEMAGKIPAGFQLGTFNLPAVDGGAGEPGAVLVWANYYFVFENGRHRREAVDFLRFLTSRRMAGRFARLQDFPAAVVGANEGNLSADLDELMAIIRGARGAYGEPPRAGFPELEQHRADLRYALLLGRITPEAAARGLEEAARVVRARRAHPDRIAVRHLVKPLLLLAAIGAAAVLAARGLVRRRAAEPAGGGARASAGTLLVFLAPAALVYTALVVLPSLRAFGWSALDWDGLGPKRFVGLTHFARLLFESDAFWAALGNNLFLMLVVPAFVLPLSLFFAACLARGVRGAALFRVVFFFPNLLGGVAAALLWMHLYNPQRGPLNALLAGLGLEGFRAFAWLGPDHLYWALVPMFVWSATGFYMVLFLAAIQGIPRSLYEAAELDGAGPARQFFSITLPMIRDVLAVAVVFLGISGMKAFEVIWLLTNQQPTTSNHVVATRMVQALFTELRVGEATALAVLLFVLVFSGTLGALRLLEARR